MSIGIIAAAGPPGWVLAAWLVLATVAAVIALRRGRVPPEPTSQSANAVAVPLLAVAAVVGLVAWFAAQTLYFLVFPPALVDGHYATLSAADLAMITTWAGLVGWAAIMTVLTVGRGRPLVGYGTDGFVRGAVAGVVGAFVAIPVTSLALVGTLHLWAAVGYQHPPEHELLNAMRSTPSAWVRVLSVVSAVVTAPLSEELLFRGCLQNAARRASGSAVVAVLVAGVPFALIHSPWTMPPIFVLAVMLGVVYERTRNLWATTVMHALFNGASVATSLLGG